MEAEALRLDNDGSELRSHAFQDLAKECGIALRFIAPGKPNQSAFIERFDKAYREVLSAYLFESIGQARELWEDCRSITTMCGPTNPSAGCRH